jgi:PIN domain nuclease of toxin-antitoxin system
MSAVLDTHAAIWYLLDTKNLSEAVFSLIDGLLRKSWYFIETVGHGCSGISG